MLSRTACKSVRAVRSFMPRSGLPLSTSSRVGVANWSEFGQQHVAHGLSGRLSNAVIESGKGSYIKLNDKRGEYLDFTSGIGVTALGASFQLNRASYMIRAFAIRALSPEGQSGCFRTVL